MLLDPGKALNHKLFMAEAYRQQNKCAQALDAYNKVIADKESNPYQGRSCLGRGLK